MHRQFYNGAAVAFAAALLLSACGGGSGSGTIPSSKPTVSPTPVPTAASQLPPPSAATGSASLTPSNIPATSILPATGGMTGSLTVPALTAGSGNIAVTVASGGDATMARRRRVTAAMAGGPYLWQMDLVPSQTMTFAANPSFSLDVTQYVTGAGLSIAQAASLLKAQGVYAGIVDSVGAFSIVGPLTVNATSSTVTIDYAGPKTAVTLVANHNYTIGVHLGPIAAPTSTPAPTPTERPTASPTAVPTATPMPTSAPTATPMPALTLAGNYSLTGTNLGPAADTGSIASDGSSLWLASSDNNFSYITKMGLDGSSSNYAVNTGSANGDKGYTVAIAAGPDGNMWFTDTNESQSESLVGKITASGTVTRYAVDAGTNVDGIVAGPDGNLWFTEGNSKVGKVTTSGTVTLYTMPDSYDAPHRIIVGPDGSMWFTETGRGDRVGKITTSGTISQLTLHDSTADTSGYGTDGIAVGTDGNLWVAEAGLGKLAKINPATGSFTEYTIGLGLDGTPLQDVAADANGLIWVSEPAWSVQFNPGRVVAVSESDGSIVQNATLPGYVKLTTFASDAHGKLFVDPLGDFWGDGVDVYQLAP